MRLGCCAIIGFLAASTNCNSHCASLEKICLTLAIGIAVPSSLSSELCTASHSGALVVVK